MAVSQVDSSDFGGQGNYLSYDAVYLKRQSGWSVNLATKARASNSSVVDADGATILSAGDEIYFGSSRFVPACTYFWMHRAGSGGTVTWYYSSSNGSWRLVNGVGKPAGVDEGSAALDADGSFSFDIGNYFEPDERGFSQNKGPHADRIVWWRLRDGIPGDYAAATLPIDSSPRHYLKGVVTRTFQTAPILTQLYERELLSERITIKYGPGRDLAPYLKWGSAIGARLSQWGFNATGQYSYRYWQIAPQLSNPLPIEPTWQLSGAAMRSDRPYHVKNVYAGAVCPPGSSELVYQGRQADVFDPGFERALTTEAAKHLAEPTNNWSAFALIPEEADDLFGLNNADAHPHLGYIVAAQNPHVQQSANSSNQIDDSILYSKYAWRDFLKRRYVNIAALNTAWGTHYTTWDTSSGDVAAGTNAWGSGTGFLDEDGRHIYYPSGVSCQAGTYIQNNKQFTDPAHPSVRNDLDDFVEFFSASYAQILAQALSQAAHPPVFLPLYRGPDAAYRGAGPYVDGFWVAQDDPGSLQAIYNESGKPIIVADYSTANPDSPLFVSGTVESASYDHSSALTTFATPDMEYIFRAPWHVSFSSSTSSQLCAGGSLPPAPIVFEALWNTVAVRGDYTRCVHPGDHIRLYDWVSDKRGTPQSQTDRASKIISRIKAIRDLRGNDGARFVVGFEHWALYDNSPSNFSEIGNFGLLTLHDNAYNGVEARREPCSDSLGYDCGGEERAYGDLLGPLSSYLTSINTSN